MSESDRERMNDVKRFTRDDHPRGPWYVPQVPPGGLQKTVGAATPVYRYWPILTPDGGILMASTDADAARITATLNEQAERIEALEAEVERLRLEGKEASDRAASEYRVHAEF